MSTFTDAVTLGILQEPGHEASHGLISPLDLSLPILCVEIEPNKKTMDF